MSRLGHPGIEIPVADKKTLPLREPARVVVSGKLFRTAAFQDEEWREAVEIGDPLVALSEMRRAGRKADVFSFTQRIPDVQIRHRFPYEMRNAAVVPITSYIDWWENRVPQETRKNVRRAGRRGVTTAKVEFGDELVRGIKAIYDETPIRQGRQFWHYRKDGKVVKRENATYLDRCDFIGAYFEGELIGFIKIVYVDRIARIMQIVAMQAHEDKRPTNALLAKAVEVCETRGMSHFVYGQYVYGNKTRSPMTEFKRRNGFERLDYPKYYVPLTLAGRVYVTLGLYRGMSGLLPEPVVEAGLAIRTRLLNTWRGSRDTSGAQLRAAE
jgi:hypothetical protein